MQEIERSSAGCCQSPVVILQHDILLAIDWIRKTMAYCFAVTSAVRLAKLVPHGTPCRRRIVKQQTSHFDHSVQCLAKQIIVLY